MMGTKVLVIVSLYFKMRCSSSDFYFYPLDPVLSSGSVSAQSV